MSRPDSDDVRAYYDAFLSSRMLDYRIKGNLRLERAATRALSLIHPGSRVLDIGCGIGIVTERVAKALSTGHVWACDISERNIWYAKQTVVDLPVTFFTADITADFDAIAATIRAPVDFVMMIDVIEHLPLDSHAALFSNLRRVTSPDARILLTYPSPYYQAYLKKNNPDELQIVDESIDINHLMRIASNAGFHLFHYSLEDMWRKNQYAHCVLHSDTSVASLPSQPEGIINKAVYYSASILRKLFIYPVRRKRYITNIKNKTTF